MKIIYRVLVTLCVSSCILSIGQAEIKLDGYFIARDECPAYHSKRKQTNPGDIHLVRNLAYEVLSKNKAQATHYRIRVEEATPQERWVAIDCGKLLVDCREQVVDVRPEPDPTPSPAPQPTPAPTPDHPPQASGRDYLLALSWQPAFCQTHQRKTECETQTSERYDANHLALHGLWPQPRSNVYCNVSNNRKKLDKRKMWDRLPPLGLTEETYGDLLETMPGVASYLHRHEWIKHGTCYSSTAEEYYRESILLIDQVNGSRVRDLFASNIGQRITSAQIKAKFDQAFGAGAGDKVQVKCDEGMIVELWINLKGVINDDTKLSGLLQGAAPASASCAGGIVDPVGF
ncbi:MAG: ribonuclease T2 [Gammaproteobacteria bacterium]|nr:ribonuclease T2 [Gammaproteobacteria bacterium]